MPLPKTPEGQIDIAKLDAVFDAMLALLEVQNRQIVALGNIVVALRSDGPATFTLPDPPAHLMPKAEQDPDT